MRIYFAAAIGALAAWSAPSAAQNVALGKPVSIVTGTAEGAEVSTLVDDAFLDRGTSWQTGTVWWLALDTMFQIDLGATYTIDSLVVQADDNDAYDLLYRVPGTATWSLLWAVPNYDEMGTGIQTRPNPDDARERYTLPTGVQTDALRFAAHSGDDMYAVSEIQAWVVPGPGSIALAMAAGLWSLRRRARAI